jgi:glycosyltransferase involved in cell wall biosynthesis
MNEARSKPSLLVLTSTYPRWRNDHEPGFVHELCRRLTDRFDVSVLAPHDPGALQQETLDGVRVHRFRYAPDRFERLAYRGGIPANLKRRPWLFFLVPWFLTAQLLAAYRLVREARPEVVHAHWLLPSGLIGAMLQELPGASFRLVVTAHGADVHLAGDPLSRLLKREVLRSANQVTVVSTALRDKLESALPHIRPAVAPMGVDLQHRFVPAGPPDDDPTLVFAGRLVEKKGVDVLLHALQRVRQWTPEIRLLIAGHGPLESELRKLTSELALEDRVSFLGSIPNERLPAVLSRAHIAVLPFRIAADGDQEGLGLVTVEAMGCGVPVIASDLPAIHDVITDDVNGRLVPPDDPIKLSDTIIELLANPETSRRLARQARQRAVERFDWDVVSARYADLLDDRADC